MELVTGYIIAVASVALGLVVGITLTEYRARLHRQFQDIQTTIDGRLEELDRRVDRHVEDLDRRIDTVSENIAKPHKNKPS
jgi:uncharacterized membrane-anchored protein YhcB (DUF1043 family)